MAISTYAELKAAVASWLRPNMTPTADMTARIPEYVAMAEAAINRRLKSSRMDAVETALAIVSGVAACPTGYLANRSFRLTDEPYNRIEYLPIDQIEALDPAVTDKPYYFDRVGDSLICYPPTTATARLRYRKALVALSGDSDTNWLLTNFPDAYLYGSLIHADRRLIGPRLQAWESGFDSALAEIDALDRSEHAVTVRPQPGGHIV